MALLVAFAFLAGVVTVLSPCILPVLPVVLSGGVSGGRGRPWGIVAGFLVTFTVFTLTLSALVRSVGLDPEVLRWISAGLILLFGLVLVVPVLKDGFLALTTKLLCRPTRPLQGKNRGGFWSGLVLGFGLGVVWTPCVGPIMASVIALSLGQTVDAGSVFITLAYTVGTALPLFLVMVGGRALVTRVSWLTRRGPLIQKVFGVLMVATALALFTGADRGFSSWVLTSFPSYGAGLTSLENQDPVRRELQNRQVTHAVPGSPSSGPSDPLSRGQGVWINSPALTLGGLKGKVVLVDFWTYSCINCLRTLPYLKDWYSKYHDKGLVIVGVHSPEFAFEHSQANVRRAVAELGVTWPVVQDNGFGIWNAYQNQYWPAHYLYGRDGTLIETHFGEGDYAETEATLAQALGTAVAPPGPHSAVPVTAGAQTPETYLGYGRGQRFASPEEVAPDQFRSYSLPKVLPADQWALGGGWSVGREFSTGVPGASLELQYQGARVYLVVGPVGPPVPIQVTVDGQSRGTVTVDGERMYTLVDDPTKTGGRVHLEFGGTVQIYAFTFG